MEQKIVNTKPIVIISGPSGSGKGSVAAPLRNMTDWFVIAVSYTTRQPREGEIDGEQYHFISMEQFNTWISQGAFLEWGEFYGHKYGTLKSDFDMLLTSGKMVLMELDVVGTMAIKRQYDKVITIFISPPKMNDAAERLQGRDTEDPKEFKERTDRYIMEMQYEQYYDYVVINDDLERAQTELISIIEKEVNYTQ